MRVPGGGQISTGKAYRERRGGHAYKIAKLNMGVCLLKCKNFFYIYVDFFSVSAYNKSEGMKGGHHNEV